MSGSGETSRRDLVWATVLLVGMLSILLLLWADRISVRLHEKRALIDTVMDAQIHMATYHLRLEETLHGEGNVDAKEPAAVLAQATHLIDVILSGGRSENDRIVPPLVEPGLRFRAMVAKSAFSELGAIGLARVQESVGPEIDPALDREFEAAYRRVLDTVRELEEVLETEEAEYQKDSRRLFVAIVTVWTLIVAVAAAGLRVSEGRRAATEAELREANDRLRSQTEELTEHREQLEVIVKKRLVELAAKDAHLQIETLQRREAEEKSKETGKEVQRLTASLLNAQEAERKRISLELHDELGQALAVTKLRTRVIERGLREDQGPLRQDCGELLEYLDQVIENVRRLALDLSPTVLEDLGLTAALRWLVSNLQSGPTLRVVSSIADIDRLLPREHWIGTYRAVQEALTNVVKHAEAKMLSLDIRLQDGTVVFAIEDDGKGFDPVAAATKNASPRALGLRTLAERITIIGGTAEVRSGEGRGTRITFRIPIAGAGAS